MGCYFSINIQMLANSKGYDLIKNIPKNLILTETDGPFTTINGQPQRPQDIQRCIEKIASIWKLSTDETKKIILDNFITIEQ